MIHAGYGYNGMQNHQQKVITRRNKSDTFQEDKFQEEIFQEDTFHEDKIHEDKFHEEKFHEDKSHKDKFHEDKFHEDKFHKDKFQEDTFREDKGYCCWIKWMRFGEKTGCHQRPDRSFFIKDYQMPICARCFGVCIGYIIAVTGYFLVGFTKILSFAGCFVMFLDWLLQEIKIKESTNGRRFVTGLLGGYGIMSLQLALLKWLLKLVHK
ncbi:MAG: hypothetical protein K0S76_1389 [Herbinix sp.]|nr:hypothetical protein [Herbinix sp.]